MSEKRFTEELVKKITSAKSIEELKQVLTEEEINLSDKEIEDYYNFLSEKSVETIEDYELCNTAGGTCYSSGVAKKDGITREYVIVTLDNSCPGASVYEDTESHIFSKASCRKCRHRFGAVPAYCGARWTNHETLNPNFDPGSIDDCNNKDPFVDGPKNWN